MKINIHCHCPVNESQKQTLARILDEKLLDYVVLVAFDLKITTDTQYRTLPNLLCTNEHLLSVWEETGRDERILPFVYVDPREENAAETLVYWIQEQGFKGVKLYPPIGFYPDDERLNPFYETANELAIPMLFHAGRVAPHPQVRSKFCRPVYYEGPAHQCPNCAIIMGHFGVHWFFEAYEIGKPIPNIYFDLTTALLSEAVEFVARGCKDPRAGASRFAFGTDGLSAHFDKARETLASAGISEEDLDMIFGGSAARILKVV